MSKCEATYVPEGKVKRYFFFKDLTFVDVYLEDLLACIVCGRFKFSYASRFLMNCYIVFTFLWVKPNNVVYNDVDRVNLVNFYLYLIGQQGLRNCVSHQILIFIGWGDFQTWRK